MKKIALATAAVLALSGAAFAENPHVGGQNINTIAQQQQVDGTRTSSVNAAANHGYSAQATTADEARLGGNS